MHTHAIQSNGNDEPICRAGIETQTENRLVDTAGGGEGGTNRVAMKHILSYVKQMAIGKLLTGSSTRYSNDVEGWEGGSRGRGNMHTYG